MATKEKVSTPFYSKLFALQQSVDPVKKTTENPHFKKMYADLNSIITELMPHLQDNGLILIQPIINGCVVSKIIDIETGECLESSMEIPSGLSTTPVWKPRLRISALNSEMNTIRSARITPKPGSYGPG